MESEAQNKSVSIWEKLKVISTIIAAILIPLAIAIVGNEYSKSIKEKEAQSHFVELALNILTSEPNIKQMDLREWATQVIDKYSGIPFSDSTKQNLISNYSLPSFNIKAYESLSSLLIRAIYLMDQATEPYLNHKREVEKLFEDFEEARIYVKEGSQEKIMFDILIGKDRYLLGGFFKRWEQESTLSMVFITEARNIILEAFMATIKNVSSKN